MRVKAILMLMLKLAHIYKIFLSMIYYMMQPKDIQLSKICWSVLPNNVSEFRSCISVDINVHHLHISFVTYVWPSNKFCYHFICRQTINFHLNSVLDQSTSQWTSSVVGHNSNSNGFSHFDVIKGESRGEEIKNMFLHIMLCINIPPHILENTQLHTSICL